MKAHKSSHEAQMKMEKCYLHVLDAVVSDNVGWGKGHFFSDHSALTNRPDAKTQLSLIFFEDLGF